MSFFLKSWKSLPLLKAFRNLLSHTHVYSSCRFFDTLTIAVGFYGIQMVCLPDYPSIFVRAMYNPSRILYCCAVTSFWWSARLTSPTMMAVGKRSADQRNRCIAPFARVSVSVYLFKFEFHKNFSVENITGNNERILSNWRVVHQNITVGSGIPCIISYAFLKL